MINHCVRTIHAETNAIVQSARNGDRIDETEIYVTASQCYDCFKLIANAGIKKYSLENFTEMSESISLQNLRKSN